MRTRRVRLSAAEKNGPTLLDDYDDAEPTPSQPEVVSPTVDAFANLSKTLQQHVRHLDGPEAKQEAELRDAVIEGLRGFKTDRSNLGALLTRYKSFFKSKGHWTAVVKEIGQAVELSERTVFRIIDDYEQPRTAQDPSAPLNVDNIRGGNLTKQERRECAARLAIRTALNDIPKAEKLTVLKRILAEEAYQVWGDKDSRTLTITPTPSRFTIDGRKKSPSAAAEVAA